MDDPLLLLLLLCWHPACYGDHHYANDPGNHQHMMPGRGSHDRGGENDQDLHILLHFHRSALNKGPPQTKQPTEAPSGEKWSVPCLIHLLIVNIIIVAFTTIITTKTECYFFLSSSRLHLDDIWYPPKTQSFWVSAPSSFWWYKMRGYTFLVQSYTIYVVRKNYAGHTYIYIFFCIYILLHVTLSQCITKGNIQMEIQRYSNRIYMRALPRDKWGRWCQQGGLSPSPLPCATFTRKMCCTSAHVTHVYWCLLSMFKCNTKINSNRYPCITWRCSVLLYFYA